MFRSRTRSVVYPQAEHARVAGAIAAAWAHGLPVPFAAFVRGVELHDRGYGELDDDEIGAVARERWLDIQRRGFAAQDDDPVVDLVVALHIARLVGDEPREFSDLLPARLEAAGVGEDAAAAADLVTNLCDRISFDLCLEIDSEGSVGSYAYTTSSSGEATIDPWPLGPLQLDVPVTAYAAEGYPSTPEPLPRTFLIAPRRAP